MSAALFGSMFIAAVLVLCPAEGKHWPDLSCHPSSNSSLNYRYVQHNRMGWVRCNEPYVKYKEFNSISRDKCPQICVLQRNRILVRKVKGGPNVFDIDQFVFYFAEELDYSMDNPSPAEKLLMDKARLGFEDCKKKNKEYETMKNLSSNDCERWDKFFKCIENAIGCGEWQQSSS